MKTRYKVFNLIVAFLLIAIVIGNVFAWFSGTNAEMEISGASAGAYFAYGDGTATAPYGITEEKHLFNLAWLQNTGKIPEKTYFELGDDITIEKGYVLPPIGNAENPFDSTFNGNGKTIDGLIISTNKNVLYGAPADSGYSFSNAVGMFGMTGENSEIKNFILKDPTVEVAENGGGQSTHYAENETTDKKAVGIAIGYVNGKASSIGVNGGRFLVRKDDYSTFNSILGNMSEDAMNNNNLTGGTVGTGGSGSAFGASFDVESFYGRMEKIGANQYELTNPDGKTVKDRYTTEKTSGVSPYLPKLGNAESFWVLEKGEKMPFSVVPENAEDPTKGSTYVGDNAKEIIADNNIGYVLGSQTKVTQTNLNFGEKLVEPEGLWDDVQGTRDELTFPDGTNPLTANNNKGKVPSWFYTNINWWGDNKYDTNNTSYTPSNGFVPLTEEQFNNLPQSIKDLIPETSTETYTGIRISQEYKNQTTANSSSWGSGNSVWSYHGQISWNGKTYGADSELAWETDGYKDNTGIFLPNTSIWFKPAQSGLIKLVMFTTDNSKGFTLIKATRENADSDNPFNIKTTSSQDTGSDITFNPIIKEQKMPSYVLLYFEYEVTEEDIKNGNVEFFFMQMGDSSGKTDFLYLDIGASGEEQQDPDTGTLDTSKNVSSIDFVYDGVTINKSGDFVEGEALYIATKIKVYYDSISATLYISFARTKNGDSVDFEVTYNGSVPSKSNGTGAVTFTPSTFTFTVP